ncbi:hypothetical protein CYY_000478 [Polysphondylium violaceum]|uniref:Uncharacterized protein n=1 Tax=Polysphondylium violaceum TaxID=133409 RepID=A0A8J4Q1E9_9MYCE|nr:hypothetical protein CYY_000478 [Polysphondylium violaceum]
MDRDNKRHELQQALNDLENSFSKYQNAYREKQDEFYTDKNRLENSLKKLDKEEIEDINETFYELSSME